MRDYWVNTLYKIAHPVFHALAHEQLKATMPTVARPERSRSTVTHLEAVGRSLAGIAPWLGVTVMGDEAAKQAQMLDLVRRGLHNGCNPDSPDYLNFDVEHQPLVDAAFMAHGILRAPDALWHGLDSDTQSLIIQAMQATRVIKPSFSNWLLFSAMVEAFLYYATGKCDLMRVDFALRQHAQWYKGDGVYGDGPNFHWDYYNSYVIQPMLLDVLVTLRGVDAAWDSMIDIAFKRARRYAAVQERFIAPDGSFPVIGRSIAYRCGAFQHLAQMALQGNLPTDLHPAQVRGALTAVIKRTLDPQGTFDADGWLQIGLSGHQPSLGETYISTGSLYLCTVAFLPLGLPPEHEFWSAPDMPYTSQRIWSGEDLPLDHAED